MLETGRLHHIPVDELRRLRDALSAEIKDRLRKVRQADANPEGRRGRRPTVNLRAMTPEERRTYNRTRQAALRARARAVEPQE